MSEKPVRDVRRVYQRVATRALDADGLFEAARIAVTRQLLSPVVAAGAGDAESIEQRLYQYPTQGAFGDFLLDEMLLWTPPDGVTLLDSLHAERQLRKRRLSREFMERLRDSTTRLWEVVDARDGRWVSVRRAGGDEPPRRAELIDPGKSAIRGDYIVGRRIRVGSTRVFAEGWLPFPEGARPVLDGFDGDALVAHAFCLWSLMSIGDRSDTERWLQNLHVARHGTADDRRGAGSGAGAGADHGGGAHSGSRSGSRNGTNSGSGTGSGAGSSRRRSVRGHADDPERERLYERIRKLFAMAQQTESSPHEAEIALRRCQSLMSRFGITEADLETSDFGVASIATGRTVATHVKVLGGAVAMLHDVIFVIGRNGMAEFRGYEIDVQVATLTFEYLSETIERSLSARKRGGHLPPGRSAAFDYRVAFSNEVLSRVRLMAIEREQLERQAEASGTGTSLVVRKREQVEREFGDDLVQRSVRLRGPLDEVAAEAGREDGRDVSLERQIE